MERLIRTNQTVAIFFSPSSLVTFMFFVFVSMVSKAQVSVSSTQNFCPFTVTCMHASVVGRGTGGRLLMNGRVCIMRVCKNG